MNRNKSYFTSGVLTVAMLVLFLGMTPRASACAHPPEVTNLTFIIINPGPPVMVTLIFDPWTTFASDDTQFCSCGFRFPTALIDSLDEVRFVETGTDTLVTGFDAWPFNATTSAEIEAVLGAGSGNEWFGFLNDLSANVPSDIEADFQVDVTLSAGVTLADLISWFNQNKDNVVFSDEANSSGVPLDTHQGFVGLGDVLVPVPAVSYLGMMLLIVLMLAAAKVVINRRRASVTA
jgi:hypothetical protein